MDSQFDEVFFKLFRLMKHEMISDSETAKLTLPQLQALFYLHSQKSVQMKDISAYFHVEMPTATSLLDKLVATDLVKRQNDIKDRRVVHVLLTDKGQKVVAKSIAKRNERIAKMLSLVSRKDKENLLSILQRIVDNLENQYEK